MEPMHYPARWKLFRRQDARALDHNTIHTFGMPARILMEVAGAAAAAEIGRRTSTDQPVIVLCGKGNNAGDGLVVARYLACDGYDVRVWLCAQPDSSADAMAINLALLEKLVRERPYNLQINPYDPALFQIPINGIIIDALLGTGLTSDIREPFASIIRRVNATDVPVYALDIPTGLDPDTGLILGQAIRAQVTLCMGTLKLGLYLQDGPNLRGEVVRIDLGFPPHLHEDVKTWLIDPSWVRQHATPARLRSHKYDQDVVYILGGSSGLTGAVVLAARAAWATGVGAVIVIAPAATIPALEKHLIHEIKIGIGSAGTNFFTPEHAPTVLQRIAKRPGTMLMGPGMGSEPETAEFVKAILDGFTGQLVVDADALRMIPAGHIFSGPTILTPHPGELNAMVKSVSEQTEVRLQKAHQLAADTGSTVLSKGMPVVICDKNGHSLITGYETRYFTRAGFGDILAGKTAGFFAQSGEHNVSCIRALLDGKEKLEKTLLRGVTNPEPLDLI